MDQFGDKANIILAGATGLVGSTLLNELLIHPSIHSITALVRRPLTIQHKKLHQINDSELRVTKWDEKHPAPDLGFICLGTTLKQAGSKEKLAHVDFELVCQVAQTMKLLGVKRIAVVSSYGAKANSWSHYLRCKGKMEQAILKMGFERVCFVRPGPLAGRQHQRRKDEIMLGAVLRAISPLLIGSLSNMKPIAAQQVALTMLFSLLLPHRKPSDRFMTFNSKEMLSFLHRYQLL